MIVLGNVSIACFYTNMALEVPCVFPIT